MQTTHFIDRFFYNRLKFHLNEKKKHKMTFAVKRERAAKIFKCYEFFQLLKNIKK